MMSLIFAKIILLVCFAQIGQGEVQTIISNFNKYSHDVRYAVPPTSYFIYDWGLSDSQKYEGFISRYSIDFLRPVHNVTLKFQVWGKTNTSNHFILRGENVFKNVKGDGYTYLYPKDVDQITIRSTDTVGLYVDKYSSIPYTINDCIQQMRVYNATTPMIGQSYGFEEYTASDNKSCMSFGLSVQIVEMDLNCKTLEINNINHGDMFTTDPFIGNGPQKQCWVVRMMRPCTSSLNYSISPSVSTVKNSLYDCDHQKLVIRNGGTARDEIMDDICGHHFGDMIYTGNSDVMYIEYTRDFVNPLAYEKPFEMKYYVDLDNHYYADFIEYCNGEHKPERPSPSPVIPSGEFEEEKETKHHIFSTRLIFQICVSGGVLVFVFISFSIGGIVAYKRGKNPRTPIYQTTPATISGAQAAGSTQQPVNGTGPGTVSIKYNQGAPSVAYQAPIYHVPEPSQYPQQHPQPYPGPQTYPRQPYPQQLYPVQGYHQQYNTTQMHPLQSNLTQAYAPQQPLHDAPPPTYESVMTPPVVN